MLRYLFPLLLLTLIPHTSVAAPPALLILGDSLSAGFGIDSGKGWTHLLQQRLRENDYSHRVVNASISGDTTRGALSRLPAALKSHRPEIVIIELGGNDGLRGISLEEMQSNLEQLVKMSQRRRARVLLLGMQLPPNYGPAYTGRFRAVYRKVADETGSLLVPFFLEGIATEKELMQADGIHPTEGAQGQMLENVWKTLEPLLNETAR